MGARGPERPFREQETAGNERNAAELRDPVERKRFAALLGDDYPRSR